MFKISYPIIKNKINKFIESFSKTTFGIEKDLVYVESNNQKYTLKVDEIKKMIIGNYTISFIPKDMKK